MSPFALHAYADGVTWKQIMFINAQDNRLVHCILEYADSEDTHQDYYESGPRIYHEALVILACHVDIENYIFQTLPDDGSTVERDAIAVISDDPDHPGDATANIRDGGVLSGRILDIPTSWSRTTTLRENVATTTMSIDGERALHRR